MRVWTMALALLATPVVAAPVADLVISDGLIVDGSGGAPYRGWVAISGDRIAAVGRGKPLKAKAVVSAKGQAVAPGFINMLSQAMEGLIADGRALSDIKQGVTLEVMGEGSSMGPLTPALRDELINSQDDIKYPVPWLTLGEYLNHLEQKGVAVNVASFIGSSNPRVMVLGRNRVAPTAEQLQTMQGIVRTAMHEGAMGVASALIYSPGAYASTAELTALAKASAQCGGMYASHIRNEGANIEAALDEIISIARDANSRAEIYHLKMAGQANWGKYADVIRRIEAARASGVQLTADIYTYPASSTGLDASMPLWVQEGGTAQWIARLRDPALRAQVKADIASPPPGETNSLREAGGAARVLLVGFKNPALKPLAGKTLAEVAAQRGTSPEDTMMDLVVEDGSRVEVVYFSMDEANVRREMALPWVSFGSDAGARAPEGVFLQSSTHPRAYGNFARVLGKYVREEKVLRLAEAVRKLTSLPAGNLRLQNRGALKPGNFADVVVFDPATIADTATFAQPQQLAMGVNHVWVNGVQVLKDGQPTGATPGRFVKGPGFGKCAA